MKRQLYVVYFKDTSDNLSFEFLISDDSKVRNDVDKMIKDGVIKTSQKTPTILGYTYINGYYIAPLNNDPIKELEDLKIMREEIYEKNGGVDKEAFFGYLEALEDVKKLFE